jgi:hypothetical protein
MQHQNQDIPLSILFHRPQNDSLVSRNLIHNIIIIIIRHFNKVSVIAAIITGKCSIIIAAVVRTAMSMRSYRIDRGVSGLL